MLYAAIDDLAAFFLLVYLVAFFQPFWPIKWDGIGTGISTHTLPALSFNSCLLAASLLGADRPFILNLILAGFFFYFMHDVTDV